MAQIALKAVHPNMVAFLLMIQKAEGTYKYASPYNVGFGGKLFIGFKDHPRIATFVPGIGQYTSAAGAYQFMARTDKTKVDTWGAMQRKLNLPDFSPESQDRAAIELIKMRGAYNDVINGNIKTAIYKCRKEWASLPGANYPGQGMRSLEFLLKFYTYILPLSTAILPAAEFAESIVKKKRIIVLSCVIILIITFYVISTRSFKRLA